MSYAFISTDFALHLLASPLHLLCPGFLSQHSTFACFACLLLSSLLRRRRRERSDALWSPLSSPFTKCISREGKLKRKMCNFAAQSTETNKKRKSNFPLDGSADVGSALKQWLGSPVQLFSATSGDHGGLYAYAAWSMHYKYSLVLHKLTMQRLSDLIQYWNECKKPSPICECIYTIWCLSACTVQLKDKAS